MSWSPSVGSKGSVKMSLEVPSEDNSMKSDSQNSTPFTWSVSELPSSSISSPTGRILFRRQPSKPQKKIPINSGNNKSKTDLKTVTVFKRGTQSAVDFTRAKAFPPEYTTASSVSAPPLEYKGPFSRSDLSRTSETQSFSTYKEDSEDDSSEAPPVPDLSESSASSSVPISLEERPLQGPSLDSDEEFKSDEEDSLLTSEDFNDKSFDLRQLNIRN